MPELILLILVCIVAMYWLSSIRCKDVAAAAAKRECKRCEVQMLDQMVHQVRISMSRDHNDRWRIWREYRFEYSDDGDSRLEGHLTLLGHKVVRVALETFNPIIH